MDNKAQKLTIFLLAFVSRKASFRARHLRFVSIALLALILSLAPGVSQALQCTVDVPPAGLTSDDPYITGGTTSCATGSGNNDTGAETYFNALFPGTWIQIDKVDPPPGTDGALTVEVTEQSGGDNVHGNWFVDSPSGYDQFIMVMKAGNIPNADYKWVWFELGSTCDDGVASLSLDKPLGADRCGEWEMYLNKNLSHMSLWAKEGDGGGPGGAATSATQVAEPSAFFLLGSGLLALAGARRRKPD
jgi:hypothetical protein